MDGLLRYKLLFILMSSTMAYSDLLLGLFDVAFDQRLNQKIITKHAQALQWKLELVTKAEY